MSYVFRRVLEMIPVLFLAAVLVFVLVRLMPGDPAVAFSGEDATPAQLAAVRAELGLDKSWPVQFAIWVSKVAQGDMGVSFRSKVEVSRLIAVALPATLQLVATAALLAVLIGIPLGVWSAVRKGGWVDVAVTAASGAALGIPNFWFGMLLALLLAVYFKVLPSSGHAELLTHPAQALKYMVLPAVTASLHFGAEMTRFTRSSMLDVLGAQYVRTARSKGLAERVVIFRHALKNAMLPILTVLGLRLTFMMGGSVVVESIFSWPGVGSLLVNAIRNRDYAVVQGTLVIFLIAALILTLVTDLSYGLLDPRVRVARGGQKRSA